MEPFFVKWFASLELPKTDYLISAGDFSNDFGMLHDFKSCDYTCKNGNVMYILCNPHGYPGEQSYNWHDPTAGYRKESFIIPLPE